MDGILPVLVVFVLGLFIFVLGEAGQAAGAAAQQQGRPAATATRRPGGGCAPPLRALACCSRLGWPAGERCLTPAGWCARPAAWPAGVLCDASWLLTLLAAVPASPTWPADFEDETHLYNRLQLVVTLFLTLIGAPWVSMHTHAASSSLCWHAAGRCALVGS